MNEPKQVILMRTDLKMPKGKMVAQGAHAAMGAITQLFVQHPESMVGSDKRVRYHMTLDGEGPIHTWLADKFTKVCVGVDSEEELMKRYEQAKEAGLQACYIEDDGRTCFDGVKTATCCAIGPAWPEDVDKITGDLKLL